MVFQANKAEISCIENELLTSGMVKAVECEFIFNEDWDGLGKTAVFECGNVQIDMLIVDDMVILPHEVLAEENIGKLLRVGVYGISEDGTVIIPTIYCMTSKVHRGVDPSGDPSVDPTPTLFEQIMADNALTREVSTEARDDAIGAKDIAVAAKEAAVSASETAVDAKDAALISEQHASESASEAEHYADVAQQGAEASGYVYFNINDEDGEMYVTTAGHIGEDVDFEVNENTGELEVIYT